MITPRIIWADPESEEIARQIQAQQDQAGEAEQRSMDLVALLLLAIALAVMFAAVLA